MMRISSAAGLRCGAVFVSAATLIATPGARQQLPPSAPSQQNEIQIVISGDQPGSAPRLAVPDFIALSNDAETVDAARTISNVLRSDLEFEREFPLIPGDIVATVPAAKSMFDVPFDRWRELNVDGILIGTAQKVEKPDDPACSGRGQGCVHIEVRLFNARTRQSAFGRQYDGVVTSKRLFAHRISDELHMQQLVLRGVARTKLTFNSDRTGERMIDTIENRGAKNIFYADYDGENVTQVTTGRSLNIHSTWSPDGRAIVYTSYRGGPADIYRSRIFEGLPPLQLTKNAGENVLPVWSPDGTRIAFSSTRSGTHQIYIMNSDGSNVQRLTNDRFSDLTPTWSPGGTEIAFTSDRTGGSQVWLMSADGLNQRQLTHEGQGADRATWSPAPFNEIAYSAGTGPGQDIKILEVATGRIRQLTDGKGSNESPAFAPNGRHLAFTSTRAGKEQIFTVGSDGKDLRQITKGSNNRQANWSQGPRD
jgi:TolB protein